MLLVPESTKQLSDFMGFINGNIARKVGRLHDWSGKLWDRRYQHIIVSHEPEAQVARLKYLLAQGVKEGLVRHPEDWPGANCVAQLRTGYSEVRGGLWRDQSGEYYARKSGKAVNLRDFLVEELVRIRPIPCWVGLSRRQRCAEIEGLLREIARLAWTRQQSTGKVPMGKKRLLRQRPHHRPKKMKRSPAPAFHARSREHYQKLRERDWAFADEYREAARRLRLGLPGAVFPPGCFPPRLPYVPESRAGP